MSAFLLWRWSHSILPPIPHNREQEALIESPISPLSHLCFFLLSHSLYLINHELLLFLSSCYPLKPFTSLYFPLPSLSLGHLQVLLLSSQQFSRFSWLKPCPFIPPPGSQRAFPKMPIYLNISFPCLKLLIFFHCPWYKIQAPYHGLQVSASISPF